MKEGLEAPPTLGSMTLSKLALWNVRPLPQVTFYRDIATAILRMEVVIRLEAMQALVELTFPRLKHSSPVSAGRLVPAHSSSEFARKKLAICGCG